VLRGLSIKKQTDFSFDEAKKAATHRLSELARAGKLNNCFASCRSAFDESLFSGSCKFLL
jgi:hypothetical protein